MPGVSRESNVSPSVSGIQNQYRKVSPSPGSEISMARSSLGLDQSSPQCAQAEGTPSSSVGQKPTEVQESFPPTAGEGYGVPSVRLSDRPSPPSKIKRHESSLEKESHDSQKRSFEKNPEYHAHPTSSLAHSYVSLPVSASDSSSSIRDRSYGRVSFRAVRGGGETCASDPFRGNGQKLSRSFT